MWMKSRYTITSLCAFDVLNTGVFVVDVGIFIQWCSLFKSYVACFILPPEYWSVLFHACVDLGSAWAVLDSGSIYQGYTV